MATKEMISVAATELDPGYGYEVHWAGLTFVLGTVTAFQARSQAPSHSAGVPQQT